MQRRFSAAINLRPRTDNILTRRSCPMRRHETAARAWIALTYLRPSAQRGALTGRATRYRVPAGSSGIRLDDESENTER